MASASFLIHGDRATAICGDSIVAPDEHAGSGLCTSMVVDPTEAAASKSPVDLTTELAKASGVATKGSAGPVTPSGPTEGVTGPSRLLPWHHGHPPLRLDHIMPTVTSAAIRRVKRALTASARGAAMKVPNPGPLLAALR